MKLAQFTRARKDDRRLGALGGTHLIDIAALARDARDSGGGTPEWLLTVNSTREVIERGDEGLKEIEALIDRVGAGAISLNEDVIVSPGSVKFLPAVYPGKILAI